MKVRPPTEADASAAAELVRAFETHLVGTAEMQTADLLDEWRELDLTSQAWLVELDGRLAGYAALHTKRHTFVDGYVHPEAVGRGVGSRLVELAEAEAARRGIGRLRNGVLTADEPAGELLAARGYELVRHFYRMVIELDGPPPAPEWPAGLVVAAFDHGEAREFHAVLEETFAHEWDHEPEAFEDWRKRRLEAHGADPELWFAAKEGDEIAAVLLADTQRYGMGWVGAIGVRDRWRRRGLGLALLRHAFSELYRRGEQVIGLGVDAENPTGATRLYERAGMHVAWSAALYEKQLA